MQLNFKARDWHNWTSVILVVPMLIVGLTTVFLAHKKSLALDEVDLTPLVAWLPGYGGQATAPRPEIRASLALADGRRWIGTKSGLYLVSGDRVAPVPALGDTEVRGMATAPWGTVVAAKSGIWVDGGSGWRLAHPGDAWHVGPAADGGVSATIKDQGLLISRDGRVWTPDPTAAALAALPGRAGGAERITLGRLVMDLHTGKALVGKKAEWVWIDLLGAVWIFLGFTGLWLWWKGQTRRRDAAMGRLRGEAAHG